MPNQIIWEDNGVLPQYRGKFNPEHHGEVLNSIFGDPRIDTIKYIIGDYSGLDDIILTEDNIEHTLAMTTGAASYLKDLK